MSATIRVQHVSKRFGSRRVMDDVTFDLAPGSSLRILGPNGSGKTTLLRIMCGILGPDAGTVTPTHGFAFVPAGDRGLYQRLTAKQNLDFFARAANNHDGPAALNLLDAAHLAEREVASCSTGERRRIAIARAFATGASCILIDEPYADLDDGGKQTVERAAAQWIERGGQIVYAMPSPDDGPNADQTLELTP